MEIEYNEILEFISKCPPLTTLSEEELIELAPKTKIRYYKKGKKLKVDLKDQSLWLIRSGAVEVTKDGDLYEVFYEGTPYHIDIIDASPYENHFIEDTLIYELDAQQITKFRKTNDDFKSYFKVDLQHHVEEFIQDALEQSIHSDIYQYQNDESIAHESSEHDFVGHLSVHAKDIFRKRPITVSLNKSIKETAIIMTKENVSSVLVVDDQGKIQGILTDSDIRKRAIIHDISIQNNVSEIMTADIHTITEQTTMFEALMLMTAHNISHLPAIDDNDIPLGMISSIDILRQQSINSESIVRVINKSNNLNRIIQESRHLPRLQLQMTKSGLSAEQVNKAFTLVSDIIMKKIIFFAKEKLGPAPTDYAWMVVGSQARSEMVANSDQDNCLIISDDATAEDFEYFEKFAEFVCDALNDCGIVYCPGNVMAKNTKWRQPIKQWKEYYQDWMCELDRRVLMHAVIFFDMRFIEGSRKIYNELASFVRTNSQKNHPFLGRMAANALMYKPPLGFFRQFVLEDSGKKQELLDLKFNGLVPLNYLAQVTALAYGINEQNTIVRFEKALRNKQISQDAGKDLIAAWKFIAFHRYKHQAEQMQNGESPTNKIKPADLSSLDRKYLKDVFTVVKNSQEKFANRYSSGLFVEPNKAKIK